MSWNYGQEGPIGTIVWKSNGPGANFRFDSDVNYSNIVNFNGGINNTGVTSFTAPASWSNGATSAGWNAVTSTLVDGGTTTGQATGQSTTLNIAVQTADFTGNVSAMNVVTNSGAQTANLTGITRAFISNYNIQLAGGTLAQFESGAFVAGTTAGATGTVTYGYCVSGEFIHANTGGLTMTAVDGTLGDITLTSSGNIATAQGVSGYVQDTSGQTGIYSTLAVGIRGAFLHNAATTWPEAWAMQLRPQSIGAGAITTLGGGIQVALRGNTTGLWTNAYGGYFKSPVTSTASITNIWGVRIDNQGGSATAKAIGMYIADQSGATNNANLVLGSLSAPSGTWNIYSNSVNNSIFGGSIIQGHTASAINSSATATNAQVATGYITSTSAAPTTITLPTGTNMGNSAGISAAAGTVFDLVIDNTAGANTVTIAVNTNAILSAAAAAGSGAGAGLLTVPSGVTGLATFRLMFSSATAYAFSRIA